MQEELREHWRAAWRARQEARAAGAAELREQDVNEPVAALQGAEDGMEALAVVNAYVSAPKHRARGREPPKYAVADVENWQSVAREQWLREVGRAPRREEALQRAQNAGRQDERQRLREELRRRRRAWGDCDAAKKSGKEGDTEENRAAAKKGGDCGAAKEGGKKGDTEENRAAAKKGGDCDAAKGVAAKEGGKKGDTEGNRAAAKKGGDCGAAKGDAAKEGGDNIAARLLGGCAAAREAGVKGGRSISFVAEADQRDARGSFVYSALSEGELRGRSFPAQKIAL